MLKPVTVPKDQDPNGWERLFAYYVSQEMERSSGTPAQAAAAAKQRLLLAFGAQFPGEALPIEVEDPEPSRLEALPGGLRTSDERFWFILARVEDERSMFPESERIDAPMLASMTRAYDPEFRRAALIGPNGGPAHVTGEWSRFIPGHVEALEFDGYYLWGLVGERFSGGLEFLVEDGHTQRSISWWPSLPELEGQPPYLRHVAMLTGEPPGIANMPGLDQWFLAAEGVAQEELRQIATLETRERSLGELPCVQRSLTMKPEPKPANADGTPNTAIEPSVDLEDVIRTAVAAAVAELKPKPAPETKRAEPDLATVIAAAIKPVTDELAQLRAAQTSAAAERRNARITERLDQFVRDGKLSPADRPTYERLLAKCSETELEAELEALGKRARVRLVSGPQNVVTVDDVDVRIPAHLRQPAGEAPIPAPHMKAILKAREAASKETDPARAYQIKRQKLYEAFGEDLTN